MDALRQQRLARMGIDVWVRRQAQGNSTAPEELAAEPLPVADPAPVAKAESVVDGKPTEIETLDWDALQARVAECRLCSLCESRTRTVFGVGNRQADLMIIGEAPGAREDEQGEPFVGRAGQLLNAMLQAIGLDRQQVFIANILKCRPPDNRDPSEAEADACTPWLERQIALLQPRMILAVGRVPAHRLLGVNTAIGKLRGQIHRLEDSNIPLVVTYHPAYLLRSPGEKRKSWQDLQLVRSELHQ